LVHGKEPLMNEGHLVASSAMTGGGLLTHPV